MIPKLAKQYIALIIKQAQDIPQDNHEEYIEGTEDACRVIAHNLTKRLLWDDTYTPQQFLNDCGVNI